ncbi:MAG: FlaD/FlaE family flagellar protein [Halosimplex sp.]
MSVVAQSFGPAGPGASEAVPALVVLLTSGLVGMSIRQMIDIFGDDDGDDGDDESMADGGLMAEDGQDDDLGGFGGLDDDGGDEFGEFGDDEFDDMGGGGGGADTDELEHRLDELETEVGSLSSTVNTVRNENEQIAETVDDVEENVRKLLDIYEMVTRGVNPFADDMEPGGMGGAGAGGDTFGLFADDDDGGEEEDLDDEIANADAEGFFDEDLVEDDASPEGTVDDVMGGGGDDFDGFEDDCGTFDDGALDGGDDLGGVDDFDDGLEDFDDGADDLDEVSDDMSESSADGEGGKSFAELKDEYESGDAEWADELEADGDEGEADESIEDDLGDADDLLEDDDSLEDDDGETGGNMADDELFDQVIEDDGTDESADADLETDPDPDPGPDPDPDPEPEVATSEPAPEPEPESAPESRSEPEPDPEPASDRAATAGTASDAEAVADSEGKPYLATLPEGLASELVVVEWLEYLVDRVGVRETARAIDYYETIDWVAEPVADDLQAYLRGFDGSGGEEGLTIDHHTQSLRYISQLDGDAAETVALSKLAGRRGGGSDGLQR